MCIRDSNNVEYLTVLQLFFPQPHISNGCILDTYMVQAHPRSLAATWGIVFTFFSSSYLDVSVHSVPSFVLRLHLSRLLHSEILGLTLVCSQPKLIAAYHVLHRLLLPRHSLCALKYFNLLVFVKIIKMLNIKKKKVKDQLIKLL